MKQTERPLRLHLQRNSNLSELNHSAEPCDGNEESVVSPLQNYVDEVGHHQIYTSHLAKAEPSLTRLGRNIEQLEMMNSRLEFMMNELSSLSRRFR